MALIPREELTVLKPASELKTVANHADLDHEEMQIAYLVNNAANTGVHHAIWQHPISQETKEKLEGMGYIVKPVHDAAIEGVQYLVGGF